jgi:hypothetical protein
MFSRITMFQRTDIPLPSGIQKGDTTLLGPEDRAVSTDWERLGPSNTQQQ